MNLPTGVQPTDIIGIAIAGNPRQFFEGETVTKGVQIIEAVGDYTPVTVWTHTLVCMNDLNEEDDVVWRSSLRDPSIDQY